MVKRSSFGAVSQKETLDLKGGAVGLTFSTQIKVPESFSETYR